MLTDFESASILLIHLFVVFLFFFFFFFFFFFCCCLLFVLFSFLLSYFSYLFLVLYIHVFSFVCSIVGVKVLRVVKSLCESLHFTFNTPTGLWQDRRPRNIRVAEVRKTINRTTTFNK